MFMKRYLLPFLLCCLTLTVQAQKVINDANSEKRAIGSFHGLEVSSGVELILTAGNTEEVAVSAATNEFRDRLITKVEDGILKIYYKNEVMKNTKREKRDLKAYVSYKMLDHLEVNTGADVRIEGVLKSETLKMKANTGGVLKGKIDIGNLEVIQNTGSIITISGTASSLDVEGTTGSIFKGIDLETGSCSADVTTGAGIYITVQKELDVKATTGGFIKYKGNAGIKEAKTNTGGSVTRI
jgi:hypothetical protein